MGQEGGNKRIRQIRARASYHLFRELYDFLKTQPNTAEILKKLYEILDSRHSLTNAIHAKESLEQVTKDEEVIL